MRSKFSGIMDENTQIHPERTREVIDFEKETYQLEYTRKFGNIVTHVCSNWVIIFQGDAAPAKHIIRVYEVHMVHIRGNIISIAGHETNHRLDLSSSAYEEYHTR